MQGLNKNKADIITQLHMQKERGGVSKTRGGGDVQHGFYKSRSTV